MVYPATTISSLTFASTLGWQVPCFINTNASVFQPPPYGNMKPAINGLIDISGVMLNLLGAYAGEALIDKWVERQALRRNNLNPKHDWSH
jgi:hypothetical protein